MLGSPDQPINQPPKESNQPTAHEQLVASGLARMAFDEFTEDQKIGNPNGRIVGFEECNFDVDYNRDSWRYRDLSNREDNSDTMDSRQIIINAPDTHPAARMPHQQVIMPLEAFKMAEKVLHRPDRHLTTEQMSLMDQLLLEKYPVEYGNYKLGITPNMF